MIADFSKRDLRPNIPTISISQILGLIQEPFDKENVAQKTHDKNFDNEDSQYYHKTVEEIIAMWEAKGAESCRYGSLLDDYIGLNLTKTQAEVDLWKLDNDYENNSRLKQHCNAFDDFYKLLSKSGDTEFAAREKTVYLDCGSYYVKGRFDALFYNKRTKKWIVIDWKSSGSIDKTPNKWTKKLLGPCGSLPALNYYTYTLQLYFYKTTLKESGYLPEGTSLDDIQVMIVNLPSHIIEETGKSYGTHNPAFIYNNDLMHKMFDFAYNKWEIMKDLEEKNKKKEEQTQQEQNTDDNVEDIF
jgi:hypothetical protein